MECPEESTASADSESNRLSRIKRARAKLVNEEHRLALMKKIRQSQTRPIQQQQSITPGATATSQSSSSANQAGNQSININSQMSSITNNLNQMNNVAFPPISQHSQPQSKKLRTSIPLAASSSSSPNTTVSAAAAQLSNSFTNSNVDNTTAAAAAAAAAAAQMVSRISALQKNSPNSVGLNLSALAGLNTTISGATPNPTGSQSHLNQTPAHAHQRPKVNNLWNPPQQSRHPTPVGIAPPHVGNMSRNPITTPPNVVQAMISNLVGQQQSLLNNPINNLSNITSNNIDATTSSSKSGRRSNTSQQLANAFSNNKSSSSAQLLMQNQQQRNSGKSSLQKQIEQTLLQQNSKLGQVSGLNNFPGGASLQQTSNKRSSTSSSSSAIVSPHVGNLTRQPITTPPNVVQDIRGNLSGQQSLLMNSNNSTPNSGSRRTNHQSQHQQAQMQNLIGSQFSKPQAAQLLLQKRSAAKLAIQKQIEQTLTQLPQQKQIQLGIDFLPNANMEFCYALGLEACVDYLTKTKSPVEPPATPKPNVCSTCGSDFTPSWSWKRSQVMCENCVGSNLRKSIKSSHASRIKSVLAKASKQEQDIDQKIMAEAANVVSSASSPALSSSPLTTSSIINNNNSNMPNHNNQANQHSLLQQPSSGRNSNNNQSTWNATTTTSSRSNQNAVLANSRQNSTNNNTNSSLSNSTNVQPNLAAAGLNPTNLLSNLPPAVLASLLQMNQMPPVGAGTTSQPNNQLAQMAQLLMNQLTMNLMRR